MKAKTNLGNSYLAARQLLSQLKQAEPSSSQDNLSSGVCSLTTATCIFCATTGSQGLQLERGWKEAAGAKYGLQREMRYGKIFCLCNGLVALCKAHPTTGVGVRCRPFLVCVLDSKTSSHGARPLLRVSCICAGSFSGAVPTT